MFLDNPMDTLKIRPMYNNDISSVVDIHLAAFPDFFLTALGPSFLREFYSSIASDQFGICYISERAGQFQGFVVGTTHLKGFYKRLLRERWWRFGIASIVPALQNPRIMPRLLRALNISRFTSNEAKIGTLMSIAVLPQVQGTGVGRALVYAFLDEAQRRGVERINLTTDKFNNEKTNLFYQQLGFVLSDSLITPENREMNEYIISL